MSVIIDPRRLDAVLFELGDQPDAAVAARLRDAGVRVDQIRRRRFGRVGRPARRCGLAAAPSSPLPKRRDGRAGRRIRAGDRDRLDRSLDSRGADPWSPT